MAKHTHHRYTKSKKCAQVHVLKDKGSEILPFNNLTHEQATVFCERFDATSDGIARIRGKKRIIAAIAEDPKKPVCSFCGKRGHIEKFCFSKSARKTRPRKRNAKCRPSVPSKSRQSSRPSPENRPRRLQSVPVRRAPIVGAP
jgi:hypothetical protein